MPTIADCVGAVESVVLAAAPDLYPGAFELFPDSRDMRSVSATAGGDDSGRVVQVVPGPPVGIEHYSQPGYALAQRLTVRIRYYLAERDRGWRAAQMMVAADLARLTHDLTQPGLAWSVASWRVAVGVAGELYTSPGIDPRYQFVDLPITVAYSLPDAP